MKVGEMDVGEIEVSKLDVGEIEISEVDYNFQLLTSSLQLPTSNL